MFGVSRDATPAQVNMIIREVYCREKRTNLVHSRSSFAIPSHKRLLRQIVTNPPNRTLSRTVQHMEPGSPDCLTRERLQNRSGTPQSRFVDDSLPVKSSHSRVSSTQGGLHYPIDVPFTSSKSIGWVVCPELKTSTRWRRPRVTGPVVRFAEIYYEQNRINPFKH
jgi:hypothetical protein